MKTCSWNRSIFFWKIKWNSEKIKETIRTWSLNHANEFDFEYSENKGHLRRVKKGINCSFCFKVMLQLCKAFCWQYLTNVFFMGRIYLMLILSEPNLHIYLDTPQPLKYCGAITQLFKFDLKSLNLWVSWATSTQNLRSPHLQKEKLCWIQFPTGADFQMPGRYHSQNTPIETDI